MSMLVMTADARTGILPLATPMLAERRAIESTRAKHVGPVAAVADRFASDLRR